MRAAPRAVGLVCLLPACVAARPALASGFSVARFAAEHGHPTTDNATAVYLNPAAIALSDGPRLFLDLSIGLRRATYTRPPQPSDAVDPPGAEGANAGRATLSNWLFGPALAATFGVSDVKLGVGWFTPFGAPVSWDRRERFAGASAYPGAADGAQRWHSIEGQIYTSVLALAAARSFASGRLHLGAALNLMGSLVEDVRARGDGTNDVAREGRALVEANGFALGFGAGAVFEVLEDRLFVGLSYQSRPNVAGGMTLSGETRVDAGTESRSDVEVRYDLPDVLRLGARFRVDRTLELRLFGDYTRWSAFDRQCIAIGASPCRLAADGSARPGSAVFQNLPRDFEDTAGVRAGASVFPSEDWEIFSGAGFETRAVPDATLEPALPDFAGASFAGGARAAIGERVRLAASYTHFVFVPRDVESRLASYATPSRQPGASGHYAQFAGVVNANVEVRF